FSDSIFIPECINGHQRSAPGAYGRVENNFMSYHVDSIFLSTLIRKWLMAKRLSMPIKLSTTTAFKPVSTQSHKKEISISHADTVLVLNLVFGQQKQPLQHSAPLPVV